MRTRRLLTHTVLVLSLVLAGCRNREEQRLGELVELEGRRDVSLAEGRGTAA